MVCTLIDIMANMVRGLQPWLPCKRGCDWCCQNMLFGISDAEGERLRVAVARLDAETRARVQKRARAQLKKLRRGQRNSRDWARLLAGEARADAICPLLENHECLLYDDRLIICRCYGMGETPSREPRYGCALTTQAAIEHGGANMIDIEDLYRGIARPFAALNAPIAAWLAD